MKELLSIGEVSKILNVTIETLRNWEKKGYLKPSYTKGGHRRYHLYDIADMSEDFVFVQQNKKKQIIGVYKTYAKAKENFIYGNIIFVFKIIE